MTFDGDDLKILSICPESFAANTYALVSDRHAIIVDPSVSVDAITKAVDAEGAKIEAIILTHGHFDHIMSIDTLRRATGARVMIHKDDAEMLTDSRKNAFFTFFGKDKSFAPADELFSDGDEISLGDEVIKVISTPGHSKGSCCFLCPEFMVTGDTLFADNIGRSDLWGGNENSLRDSLKALSNYDRNLKIYPGHGPSAILGNALDNTVYFI